MLAETDYFLETIVSYFLHFQICPFRGELIVQNYVAKSMMSKFIVELQKHVDMHFEKFLKMIQNM